MANEKEHLKEIINNCDRCGTCTLVCPLYKVRPLDRATARGKIALTKAYLAGTLDGKNLQEAMEFCLLCGACSDVCPSHIMTAEAMIDMRETFGKDYGVSLKHKTIGKAMASDRIKALGRTGIAIAQKLNMPRYMGGLLPADFTLPGAQHGPANNKLEAPLHKRDISNIKRVAYFQGCAMRLFFPAAAQKSIELLKATGVEVSTPAAKCCGVPQQAHGQKELALELAKENIENFSNFDAIITDCGSCGAALAEYGIRFHDQADWREDAAAFSTRIWSLSEFLDAFGYIPPKRDNLRVTYHDSCHLNRGRRINEAPRNLLRKAVDYVEMDLADMCCGGAGSFQIDFPDVSKDILTLKYESVLRTDADILVCECPSCLMQLGKLSHKGKLRVMHISQVLI